MNGWWANWILSLPNGQLVLFSWVFWVVASIVLHELAHGWAAIRRGDDTPSHTGHMTWNPVVHLGGWSLLMLALFGFCWGAMPMNPSRLRGRYAESYVALAGPLCNLAQFAILSLLAIGWNFASTGVPEPLRSNTAAFLFVGCMINLMGFMFNLMPVPPLDGSRVMADINRPYRDLMRSESGAVISMIAFPLMFLVVGRYLWAWAMTGASLAINVPTALLGGTNAFSGF